MRLLRLDIERFRSIEDQWLPADGLVVLFGPNSAGKTAVLEASEHLLTQAETFRSDPAEVDDVYVSGWVTFDLPQAGSAGGSDALMYRSLLGGKYEREGAPGSGEVPWAWLKEELIGQLKDLEVAGIISLLADALEHAGSAGTSEDRALLAKGIFDTDAVFFTAEGPEIGLWTHGPSLPRGAMDAAHRIAAIDDDGDPLRKIAADLISGEVAHISRVAADTGRKGSGDVLPRVIVLDGDSDSLSAELQRAVPVIHDRLWHIQPEVIPSSGKYKFETVDIFPVSSWPREDGRYDEDRWLEGLSEDGQPVIPDIFRSTSAGEWYRVRHSVLATAAVIASEANKVAPSFVVEQGTIGIEILPVSFWGGGLPRIRAAFAEHGGETRDLRVVGAGTARWVAAAVRLACRRLETGRQVVTDDVGVVVTDEAKRRRIVMEARQEPFTQHAVRLEPSDAAAVYIADEPEAHLHPVALHSVRQWLTQLAATASTVLVATHSTAFLDSTSELVHRILVIRKDHRTHLRRITGAMASELALVADDL
jgi:AAA domain, putative AbiEii toxin, Type IV TA system/AAA domain